MLHNIACKVRSKMVSERTADGQIMTPVMIDPATITLIVGLTTTIIKLIAKCIDEREETKAKQEAVDAEAHALSSPEETSDVSFRAEVATDIINSPTFFQRRMLKRAIRKKIGWIKNWFEGGELYKAMLETGQETTPPEMQGLLDDVEIPQRTLGSY